MDLDDSAWRADVEAAAFAYFEAMQTFKDECLADTEQSIAEQPEHHDYVRHTRGR